MMAAYLSCTASGIQRELVRPRVQLPYDGFDGGVHRAKSAPTGARGIAGAGGTASLPTAAGWRKRRCVVTVGMERLMQ